MADSTVDISDTLGTIQKLLRIVDNGDGTFIEENKLAAETETARQEEIAKTRLKNLRRARRILTKLRKTGAENV